MAPIGWLVNPAWVQSAEQPSPSLSESLEWIARPDRHRIRVAIRIQRDRVFTDFFNKIDLAPD